MSKFFDGISYPVRGGGWAMILTGAILAVVLDFLQFVPLFGVAVALFAMGFFSGFYLDMVATTMAGDDTVPDWSSFTDFLDGIVAPFLRVVGLVIISFAPAAALLVDHKSPAYEGVVYGILGAGFFYFPMAVLGSIACGNLFGALPNVVLPAMERALPGYLVAVPGLVIAITVCGLAEEWGGRIPYVGWLVASALSIYTMMMQARIIGLIYRAKRDRLAWG